MNLSRKPKGLSLTLLSDSDVVNVWMDACIFYPALLSV